MKPACRNTILALWSDKPADAELPGASNAALVRDRYLRVPIKDEEKKHPDYRKGLFRTMCSAQGRAHPVYQKAFVCYTSSLDGAQEGEFKTKGRLIIGLGDENVLETGITLHHTYGTPFIPGTALKGLASHYCDQVWGAKGTEFKRGGEYHTAIFGTSDDSGHFIFHDAWITPESLKRGHGLLPDVMTPHHGDYYSGDGPPTDFDEPNPITFLSVAGTFHVAVSCDVPGEDGDKWADLVFRLLTDALREWGVGGKTAAGYGRLVPDGKPDRTGVSPVPGAAGSAGSRQHSKGETITVTRARDPNPKKNRPYFVADNGVGGFVEKGDPNSIDIEIGETCDLIVFSFLPGDNRYSFAIPGSWESGRH
jgi:CRISPR-associated protein Cmr6